MTWKKAVPLMWLAAAPAWAQSAPPPQETPTTRRVLNAGQVSGEVRLDGRLEEAAWAAVQPAGEFLQAYPNPGGPASQRTEVRVLVGPDALYVGARMFDTHPDSIAAQLSRRDESETHSDRILLFLDTQNDRRTAFHFGVNPRGVKQDAYYFEDANEDASWDAVWDVATSVDSLGWTAEFRIPLSQLRFNDRVGGDRVWGLGLMREIARNRERDTWSPWTENSPGFVSSFGELRRLEGIRAPSRLEVLPYTSARLGRAPGDHANPFYQSNEVGGSVGADLQYGLPGGFTLTATINPDFGQVEVDPAVVNLSAFETFFPERRPFFVEGMDIFRYGEVATFNGYGADEFFYTRRIGRSPQRAVGGGGIRFVDAPDQSTILAAAKVSGRTAGGWSVGIMDAITAREEARFLDGGGVERSTSVEPRTNYFVGRVRRDLNQGSTLLGGVFTATHRESADAPLDALLRSRAYLAGVDWEHSWAKRAWILSGFLSGSRVDGSRDAIARTQASSARYFLRPDADYLSFDTTRTSLGGYMGGVALLKNGAWQGSVNYEVASPGFEINDVGYQPRVDYHAVSTLLGRRVNRPGKLFRDYYYVASANHVWNYGGDPIYQQAALRTRGRLRNLWWGSARLGYTPVQVSDRLTFGGPLVEVPRGWGLNLEMGSDERKKVSGTLATVYNENASGAYERGAGLSVLFRPTTSLEVSVGPTLEKRFHTDQFIQVVSDALASSTYDRRYVFADVDETQLSMDARVNWTFTPNLSLQVFAQPFVNSADFSGYKELRAPRTFDFDVYGRDAGTIQTGAACGARPGAAGIPTVDPDGSGPAGCFQITSFNDRDFTLRSLRGNAVLRWEYRPGSTIFFVWQQLRGGEHSFGDFAFNRDARGLFREPAENVFMIKATYWLSR